ncbi:uncharacterized protein CTHT_0035500 [Thermochaetoides thermophila DSM 1495]|uniref:Uncharacterized protein n=1 Tax=Chaetomium thermophilum (strain DSM 1495 / CBS 144.50 / IMI 039719) TaxID=759272 RepID=G0S6T2_CHATD|nr:hypothetical protein CTHT_0035500 [Thermochaetoides thermophila DSM 1495]EGS21684.1 hypothetical protein CTHT_0035500 [Thermochaetoides thermophila DSM 1495]
MQSLDDIPSGIAVEDGLNEPTIDDFGSHGFSPGSSEDTVESAIAFKSWIVTNIQKGVSTPNEVNELLRAFGTYRCHLALCAEFVDPTTYVLYLLQRYYVFTG